MQWPSLLCLCPWRKFEPQCGHISKHCHCQWKLSGTTQNGGCMQPRANFNTYPQMNTPIYTLMLLLSMAQCIQKCRPTGDRSTDFPHTYICTCACCSTSAPHTSQERKFLVHSFIISDTWRCFVSATACESGTTNTRRKRFENEVAHISAYITCLFELELMVFVL